MHLRQAGKMGGNSADCFAVANLYLTTTPTRLLVAPSDYRTTVDARRRTDGALGKAEEWWSMISHLPVWGFLR